MRKWVRPVAALLAGCLLAGWLNDNATDDVQVVAAALFAGGLLLGFWRSRAAPLGVVLLWSAVPASTLFAPASGHHAELVTVHPLYETLVGLVPVVGGAGLGFAARRLWSGDQARL